MELEQLEFGSPDDLANALQMLEESSPDFFTNGGTIVDFTLPENAAHVADPNAVAAMDASWMTDAQAVGSGFLQPEVSNQQQLHHQHNDAQQPANLHCHACAEESPEPVISSNMSHTSSPLDVASHGSTGLVPGPAMAGSGAGSSNLGLHVTTQRKVHVEQFAQGASNNNPNAAGSSADSASDLSPGVDGLTPEMLAALEQVRSQGTAAPRQAKALAWRAYRLANIDPAQGMLVNQAVSATTTTTVTAIRSEASPVNSSPAPSVQDVMPSAQSTDSPMSGASPVPLHGSDANYSPPRANLKPPTRNVKGNIAKKVPTVKAANIVAGAGIKPARGKNGKSAPEVSRDDVIAGADSVASDAAAAVLASKASLANLAAQIAAATSSEEKAKLKKLKNREAAQLSRNIQREYVTSLESRVEHLAREKADMATEMSSLKSGYAAMADEMAQVKALLQKFMGGSTPKGERQQDLPPAYQESSGSLLGSDHPNFAHMVDASAGPGQGLTPRSRAQAMAATGGSSAARSGAFAGAGVAFFVIFFAIGFGFVNPRATEGGLPPRDASAPTWLNGANVQRAGGKVLLTVSEDAWPRGGNVDLPNIPEAPDDDSHGHHAKGGSLSGSEPCVCPCYCDDICVTPDEGVAQHVREEGGDGHHGDDDADLFEEHDSDDHETEHYNALAKEHHEGQEGHHDRNLESRLIQGH